VGRVFGDIANTFDRGEPANLGKRERDWSTQRYAALRKRGIGRA